MPEAPVEGEVRVTVSTPGEAAVYTEPSSVPQVPATERAVSSGSWANQPERSAA